jgi:hypothetical protein
VPDNPHDYVILGEPPRDAVCPSPPHKWEIAEAANGKVSSATIILPEGYRSAWRAILICGRYDWPLNKRQSGRVVSLYQFRGNVTKSRLILLANYAE